LYSVSTSKALNTDAAPAISSDGHDVVLVWLQGVHVTGGQVAMSRLLPSAFANFSNALNDLQIIGSFGPEGDATLPTLPATASAMWSSGGRQCATARMTSSVHRSIAQATSSR
jgi:hypothetical protein